MDEQQWLAATDPTPMLEFLGDSGRASERKVRLFGCACVRRVWHLLGDERSRSAVVVAERYADGAADLAALEAGWASEDYAARSTGQAAASATCTPPAPRCRCGAGMVLREGTRGPFFGCTAYPRCREVRPSLHSAAGVAARAAAGAADPSGVAGWQGAHDTERAQQARLLHDLFGPLPFRRVAVEDGWLTWNAGTVRRLAESAYQERLLPQGTLDPGRLAVLADALEKAGCATAELLGHLRGPGPHVLGCRCVDAVLGRP